MLLGACLAALVAISFATPPQAYIRSPLDERIVNGTVVPAGKYPFQVALLRNGALRCGGTIINELWVLTAAQCVVRETITDLSILSGTVNLDSGGTLHTITGSIFHEGYSTSSFSDDLAINKISPRFVWSDTVQPVPLPAQNQQTPVDSPATVIGWGVPYTGGPTMNELHELEYWTMSDAVCRDIHVNEVFISNICAYYPGGGKGHCVGDYGGPLMVDGYQAGIASWIMQPCAMDPYPGVFTQVSFYIDWINEHMTLD